MSTKTNKYIVIDNITHLKKYIKYQTHTWSLINSLSLMKTFDQPMTRKPYQKDHTNNHKEIDLRFNINQMLNN